MSEWNKSTHDTDTGFRTGSVGVRAGTLLWRLRDNVTLPAKKKLETFPEKGGKNEYP